MMAKGRCILLALLLLNLTAFGQTIKKVRDIGVWANVGLDYKVNKKWNLTYNQDIRFFDDVSKLAKTTVEFGADYKIDKQFKLSANIRYAYDRKKDNSFTHDVRYNFDFKYKLKFGYASQLKYRFRYQNTFVDLFTYYDEHTRKSNARNRIEYAYELKNHSIFLSGELFREYVLYRKPRFNILRVTLGDEVKTNLGKLEYSLNYARELNAKYPLNFFFISFGYTFNLRHG